MFNHDGMILYNYITVLENIGFSFEHSDLSHWPRPGDVVPLLALNLGQCPPESPWTIGM